MSNCNQFNSRYKFLERKFENDFNMLWQRLNLKVFNNIEGKENSFPNIFGILSSILRPHLTQSRG